MRRYLLACCVVSLVVATSKAELLLVDQGIQGTPNRVLLFSELNGELLDPNWITDDGAIGWALSQPIEARPVGNEIWLSDRLANAVFRFDSSRNFVGKITLHPTGGTLDDPVGFAVDDGKAYLAICASDASKRGVGIYNNNGSPSGFILQSRCRADVEPYLGDLLVTVNSQTAGVGRIQRWKKDGTLVSEFALGINGMEGLNVNPDQSVLVSSWETTFHSGVYHFNSDGSLRTFIDTTGTQPGSMGIPRSAYQLLDGNYLISTSYGVYKYFTQDNSFQAMVPPGSVNGEYIAQIPEPGTLLLLLAGVAMSTRKIKRK